MPPVVKTPVPPATPPQPLHVSLPIGAHARRLHGRTLSVPLRCSAACSLRVDATVRARGSSTRLRTVKVARKSAGTVTVKYTLTTATASRLRRARRRRLVLTIVPKGAPTLRKAVAISAK